MLRKLIRFRRLAFCLVLFYVIVVISNIPGYFALTKKSAKDNSTAIVKIFHIIQIVWLFSNNAIERLNVFVDHDVINNTSIIMPVQAKSMSAATNPVKIRQLVQNSSPFPGLFHMPADTTNTTVEKNETKIEFTVEPFQRFMLNLTDTSYYDPYIKAVMYTNGRCQNASSFDAIVAVHSAPGNVVKRQMVRWLYSDTDKTKPYKMKVLFFIGVVNDSLTQSKLVQEGKQYGDVVQGSFIDSYRNLTYKAVFVYNWLSRHCKGLKLLLRLDDDVFVDVHYFFKVWRHRVGRKTNTIMCDYVFNDVVRRRGKWLATLTEIPEANYNFRHCLGYFAALTSDMVPKIDEVGRRTLFFWIDDVFIYGFLAKKIGANFRNVYLMSSRDKKKQFEKCLNDHGARCNLLVFLTNKTENFIELYSLIHNNTKRDRKISKHLQGETKLLKL